MDAHQSRQGETTLLHGHALGSLQAAVTEQLEVTSMDDPCSHWAE